MQQINLNSVSVFDFHFKYDAFFKGVVQTKGDGRLGKIEEEEGRL